MTDQTSWRAKFAGDGTLFEDEVKKVARALWPSSGICGPITIDGQEIDGVYVEPDAIHIVEVTISRAERKAQDDCKSIVRTAEVMRRRYQDRRVTGWFITLDEPTADQQAAFERHNQWLIALSFLRFRAKLVDSQAYLDLRKQYTFGSVVDAQTPEQVRTRDNPIQVEVVDSTTDSTHDHNAVAQLLLEGERLAVVGEFGAGKSMFMKRVFAHLAKRFSDTQSLAFPVPLNLRDHYGQDRPAEALERHANNIGFKSSHDLVRAWRGSQVVVLLDGFDEIAVPGFTVATKRLRHVRHAALSLVRKFVQETPLSTGVLVSGRRSYFSADAELRDSIGLPASAKLLAVPEFSEEQAARLLKALGADITIPEWLPRRPLLLGFLCRPEIAKRLEGLNPSASRATGWSVLFDAIYHRESSIDAGLTGTEIRRIIEALATAARRTAGGVGPMTEDEVKGVYARICGTEPEGVSVSLLHRLPGLVQLGDDRWALLDEDFADVARAGDVVSYIRSPFHVDKQRYLPWRKSLGEVGVECVINQCKALKLEPSRLKVALEQSRKDDLAPALTGDLLRCLILEGNCTGRVGMFDIPDVDLPYLSLDRLQCDLSGVTLTECSIDTVDIVSIEDASKWPQLRSCIVGVLDGVVSRKDLPVGLLDESSEVLAFGGSMSNTASIRGLDLPTAVKVGLTVLKKIYAQKGAGRQEGSFFRGLSTPEQRFVPAVIKVLAKSKLIVRYAGASGDTVWQRNPESVSRVRALLASPHTSGDDIIGLLSDAR